MTARIDLSAIEAAAKAATPGPWRRNAKSGREQVLAASGRVIAYGWNLSAAEPCWHTLDMIAALDPQTALALVAVARAALARPWIEGDNHANQTACAGCRVTASHEWVRFDAHGPACEYAALDAALVRFIEEAKP